ncbi:MAG: type III-A CRISPR-associated RAMP protein Csm5 [Bryobacteraceae bacterium]
MRYKATALTPLLVGDGQELSPIDYMVWKDQVNVLDQPRIFRLLSRGPRLDGYLAQLRKADKLDFASWGGFAQNFSARRIPFEHASSTGIWEKTHAEHLFIPTFAANHQGPYLPGSSLKGAFRTGLVFSRWSPAVMEKLAVGLGTERLSRRASEAAESNAGAAQMRFVAAGDSSPVPRPSFKIFLTRVANLDGPMAGTREASWKVAGRGNVPATRLNESTPAFAEMAVPGSSFAGEFFERKFLADQQLARALGWRSVPGLDLIVNAANEFAAAQIEQHAKFAELAALPRLQQSVAFLQEELNAARSSGKECLICLGWGGGFLSKSSCPSTADENFRKVLRSVPAFGRALRVDAPFPKTRRVVFAGGQPAHLPGWVKVQLEE